MKFEIGFMDQIGFEKRQRCILLSGKSDFGMGIY